MRYFFLLILCSAVFAGEEFMFTGQDLKRYAHDKNVIMVCSPGRSGSTLLRNTLRESTPSKTILKSHLLPPKIDWRGKIVFIFSNPDQAAESAFHLSLRDENFIHSHFNNVETSDRNWLNRLKEMAKADEDAVFMKLNQTFSDNLLTYDALGTKRQLKRWLISSVKIAPLEKSNVLAIKYEHLWDNEVIEALKAFCGLETFPLPKRVSRGYSDDLTQKEQLIRMTYNLGTESDPRYAAYAEARAIWKNAPKFQTYRLKN